MAEVVSAFKIVVVDDDPTGSQTVHSCPLLLRWDQTSLRWGLAHPSPLLFLLANTRALAPQAAAERVRAIAVALRQVLAEARQEGWAPTLLLVSRGDSTLRGHTPLEVDVLAAELGPFDATFLVPAFLPGGRTTVAGVHRLHGEPVHTTAFARDGLFGYGTSFLPAWLEEKSGGRIAASAVQHLDGAVLDAAAQAAPAGAACRHLRDWLAGLQGNGWVAVDGERPQQLAVLAAVVRELMAPSGTGRVGRPRRFLSQSAASWIEALAQLPPQPRSGSALVALRRPGPDGAPLPGLVLVGSHVPLADAQLSQLLLDPACGVVTVEVTAVAQALQAADAPAAQERLVQGWQQQLEAVLAAGRTPVLATSRGEVSCTSAMERRRLGQALATLMATVAAALAPRLGYLISKGGITSHTLLADGLQLGWVELQGQLLPGLSLVLTPADAAVPALPVLTFPGNLGDAGTLAEAWRLMESAPRLAARSASGED